MVSAVAMHLLIAVAGSVAAADLTPDAGPMGSMGCTVAFGHGGTTLCLASRLSCELGLITVTETDCVHGPLLLDRLIGAAPPPLPVSRTRFALPARLKVYFG